MTEILLKGRKTLTHPSIHLTNLLNICIKTFNAEINIFDKIAGFEINHFPKIAANE